MHQLLQGLVFLLLFGCAQLAAQDYPVDPRKSNNKPSADGRLAEPSRSQELISPFQMADRFVVPGNRKTLHWQNVNDLSPGEMPSPVVINHGAFSGPVLCLISGVHGDEINGIATVRRVAFEIDPEQLSGTVIAVPIVNVFGYSRGSRYLPDRRDLNRYFPGTRHGSIASRLANSLFETVIRRCDFVVDFHTGSFQRSNLPQVRADLANAKALDLAHGFGGTLVLHSPGSKGMLRNAAMDAGIASATFEIGAPSRLEMEHIEPSVIAIGRLMRHLNMLPAETRRRDTKDLAAVFFESRWVRTNAGGLLVSEVALGQSVRQGQRLGVVVDPLSNTQSSIHSPFPGRVIGMSLNQQVLPGYAAYHLAKLTTEQQAVQSATTSAVNEPVPEDDPENRPNPDEESEREETEHNGT